MNEIGVMPRQLPRTRQNCLSCHAPSSRFKRLPHRSLREKDSPTFNLVDFVGTRPAIIVQISGELIFEITINFKKTHITKYPARNYRWEFETIQRQAYELIRENNP